MAEGESFAPPTMTAEEERESNIGFVDVEQTAPPPTYEKPSIEKAWAFYYSSLPKRIAVIKSKGIAVGADGKLGYGNDPHAQQSDKGTGFRQARAGELIIFFRKIKYTLTLTFSLIPSHHIIIISLSHRRDSRRDHRQSCNAVLALWELQGAGRVRDRHFPLLSAAGPSWCSGFHLRPDQPVDYQQEQRDEPPGYAIYSGWIGARNNSRTAVLRRPGNCGHPDVCHFVPLCVVYEEVSGVSEPPQHNSSHHTTPHRIAY